MTPRRGSPARRRGFMVIVALVCVAVVALMGLSALRMLVEERRHLRAQAWELQAEWLADAGMQRAEAMLAAGGDYAGETWLVPPEDLGGEHAARVQIAVETIADRAGTRRVRVVADYPDDPRLRARRTLETVVAAP